MTEGKVMNFFKGKKPPPQPRPVTEEDVKKYREQVKETLQKVIENVDTCPAFAIGIVIEGNYKTLVFGDKGALAVLAMMVDNRVRKTLGVER